MDFHAHTPHKKAALSLLLNISFVFLIITFSVLSSSSTSSSSSHRLSKNLYNNISDDKCAYVRSHSECKGKGYINYLEIFYCTCKNQPALGYLILTLWLVILFYVLGNTTAEYFIPSVESLSSVLKLSPVIAGTTLLPLGNGANDVFSSVISFARSGDGDVGLNSILGGAFFISCFVVGIVSISISSRKIAVDKPSFVRDVVFLLFVLGCLLVVVIQGKINIWFALCFISLYPLYIAVVFVMNIYCNYRHNECLNELDFHEVRAPLLSYVDEEKGPDEWPDHDKKSIINGGGKSSRYYKSFILFLYVIRLPLHLPRRLTIPMASENKWSKAYATLSTTLAPLLVASLCISQEEETLDFNTRIAILLSSIFLGFILGVLTLFLTKKSGPPKRFLLPWLAGSFVMSIAWTYIIVEELVSLLVALGHILGINPSILGLTVLAWGNSVGDLVSNLALALRGGSDGAQVAVSGCYAGPLFNTLVGLGLSLVFCAWKEYPYSYVVPKDDNYDLYETVGFLMGGLLWALVILPKRNMEMDRSLGVGLLAIYFCFLFLRLAESLGLIKLNISIQGRPTTLNRSN